MDTLAPSYNSQASRASYLGLPGATGQASTSLASYSGIPSLMTLTGNFLVGGAITSGVCYFILGFDAYDSLIMGALTGAGIDMNAWFAYAGIKNVFSYDYTKNNFASVARDEQLALAAGLPALYSWFWLGRHDSCDVAHVAAAGAAGLVGLVGIVYGFPNGNFI